MYCNNCGTQMKDDQPYCGKCGKGNAVPKIKLCEKCGNEVAASSRFCNVCGAVVNSEKRFCRFCGTELETGNVYCIQCGNAADRKVGIPTADDSCAQPVEGSNPVSRFFNNLSAKLTAQFSKRGGELADRRVASLAWKHAFAALLLVVIMIMWFLPVYAIDAEITSFLFSDNIHIGFSIADPLGPEEWDQLVGSSSEIREFKVIYGIGVVLFDYIPMLLALVYFGLPFFRMNMSKRRRMIWPILVSVGIFFRILNTWGVVALVIDDELGSAASVSLTFGGWMILLLAIALFVLSIVMARENKRVREGRGQ